MPIKRCDMCFMDKAGLEPIVPHATAVVCKACAYKARQVIGFLEYHGVVLTYQQPLDFGDAKSKSKASKAIG